MASVQKIRPQRHYLEEELYSQVTADSSIFAFLQEGALDGIWYWDLENQANEWMSPRFWTTLGFDPESKQHLVSEWQDLIFAEDQLRVQENLEKHLANPDIPFEQDVRYKHKSGKVIWIKCRGLAIRDSKGKPIRMLGAHTEITKIKTAENELYEFFALATDMMCIAGLDGHFKKINRAFTTVLGYNEAFILATPFLELVHPEDRGPTISQMEKLSLGENVINFSNRYLCANGSYKWINWRAAPSSDGNLHCVAHDISEEKAMREERARLFDALQASNQELEQFGNIVAHDLQEPLRMISSYLQLLSERYQDQLDEKADKYINYAVDGAHRMSRLLDDLLAYSRVSEESAPLAKVDMSVLCKTVLHDLKVAIDDKGAQTHVDSLPVVMANPTLLRQVMQNIIQNALKFCDTQPEIRIFVADSDDPKKVVVGIQDNGIGIAKEYQERIFEVFQRLHAKSSYEGTGMGLAISRRMIDKCNGELWLESEPGTGSTFYFSVDKENEQ